MQYSRNTLKVKNSRTDPQDNTVVRNKHNWPEFYPGNARACPGLEPPMLWTTLFVNVLLFNNHPMQSTRLSFHWYQTSLPTITWNETHNAYTMLIKVSSAIFAQVNQNATNLVNILKGGMATIITWTKQARLFDKKNWWYTILPILATPESVNRTAIKVFITCNIN